MKGLTITVQEAAAIIGLSAVRVRALIASKELGATKVGHAWVIRRRNAEALAAKDRRGPGRPQGTPDRWTCHVCKGRGYVDDGPQTYHVPPTWHGPTRRVAPEYRQQVAAAERPAARKRLNTSSDKPERKATKRRARSRRKVPA